MLCASREFPRNYTTLLSKAIARLDYPPQDPKKARSFDPEKDLRFRKGDIIVLTDSRPRKRWWSGFVLDPRWERYVHKTQAFILGPSSAGVSWISVDRLRRDYSSHSTSSRAGLPAPTPLAFPSDFVQIEPNEEPFEISATFAPLGAHAALTKTKKG